MPVNEWSARRTGYCLHNAQSVTNTKTKSSACFFMWLKGFYIEPAIAADLHLRRHGHRDRLILLLAYFFFFTKEKRLSMKIKCHNFKPIPNTAVRKVAKQTL